MLARGKLTGKVLEARRREPSRLMTSISQEHGVSRERVRQILARAYKETQAPCYLPNKTGKFCRRCGNQTDVRRGSRSYNSSILDRSLCTVCVREARMVPLTCAQCHQPFLRSRRLVKLGQRRGGRFVFCTPHCRGTYMGIHYGFAAHPENSDMGRYSKGKHWWTPLLPEIRLRRLQGITLMVAMADLGIPRGNYSGILHALEVAHA